MGVVHSSGRLRCGDGEEVERLDLASDERERGLVGVTASKHKGHVRLTLTMFERVRAVK